MNKKLFVVPVMALMFGAAPVFAEEGGKKARADKPPQYRTGKAFEKMDLDADGAITKEEFQTFQLERFNKMDLDGDGLITADEGKAHREEMRKKMKEKREEYRESNDAKNADDNREEAPTENHD